MSRHTARRTADRFGGSTLLVAALAAAAVTGTACNRLVTQGRAASFPIIDRLEAASGADPSSFRATLASDVVTIVSSQVGDETVRTATVFEDVGRVIMRMGFKDPGTPQNPTTPTSANIVTIYGYRVVYRRADGRNTPGVDVPHPFDGGLTFSIFDISSSDFTLVRVQAKLEPPLRALAGSGGAIAIATIAEVTFFARDQTGATMKVVGEIFVNFADYGDP